MRVGIVTLGCDKNTVDNEYLAGMLSARGCEVMPGNPDGQTALDAVVVTTCGFIGAAKEQSVQAIFDLAEAKREHGNPARLFVAGCLAQRYADDILAEFPEIDGLVGVGQFGQLADMILAAATAEKRNATAEKPLVDIYQFIERKKLDDRPYAFLKLADGCNHACTFCSIPSMKGKLRSVPHEILLEEARGLLKQGIKEINLVAQDLADYGRDRWKDYRLPQLLRDLCALEGDFWIRCFYLYPGGINDAILEQLATQEKIVPYVDMPLQHLDGGVLHRMKRPYRDVNTVKLVERMRAAVPNLTLRTTMIVGFPGETDAEHQQVLEVMEAVRFDRLGAFQYSQEEDTPAGIMENQVPDEVKAERWRAVMNLQSQIHAEHSRARTGSITRVLVEGYDAEAGAFAARSAGEAPEVDGLVYVESERLLPGGEFLDVEITGALECDLFAVPA
ncbi:MAG: 30S ribosomal protein S12 methylthiotransferase RimO [Candidatus Hydrogenedentes bacterium]|nr:30S ribosomal protein S12 methylthiotransferase RimO [Candidatus Hydrogenedentota bacterium]